jgi:hypothetical protein
VDDLSGHDGAWSTAAVSESVSALVKLAGRSLLPMMVAVSDAVARGQQPASYEVEGVRINGFARPDVAQCWLWLKKMFAELPYGERQILRPLLEEAGFWNALAFTPGEADRVPVFSMSCPKPAFQPGGPQHERSCGRSIRRKKIHHSLAIDVRAAVSLSNSSQHSREET